MKNPLFNSFGACLIGLLASSSLYAQTPPNVEYSADTIIETEDGATKGKVYFAPGKERRELTHGAEKMISIMRHDKKVTWMIMPEDKMYMEMKMGSDSQSKDDLSAYKIEPTVMGQEKLNGIDTTKSKIIMTDKDSKMGGFMWTTKEGIMVKIDAIAIEKGKKDRFKSELTNLQIGKQDPALFEIPKGFQTMAIPGMDMDAMQKMMKGR